jgi:hypothetical protein
VAALSFGLGLAGLPAQTSSSVQASAPRSTPAIFDPARGVVMTVEGGAGGRMWEWTGTRWSARLDVSTNGIGDGLFSAYDPGRGRPIWVVQSGANLAIQEWDGAQWHIIDSGRPFPGIAGVAFDPLRGRLVILSFSSPGILAVIEWDGSTWWPMSLTSAPVARTASAVAWDPNRRAVVFHGGSGPAGPIAGTWSWDGTAFTLISAGGPGPRSSSVMSFDARSNRLILHGGLVGQVVLGDTWALDAQGWIQLSLPASPGPRFQAQMVEDGSGLLLFGGFRQFIQGSERDVPSWRWNGAAWQQLAVQGEPYPYRMDHEMVWDEARRQALLFGGTDRSASTVFADSWTWNGTWHHCLTAHAPSGVGGFRMAPDPARRSVVWFGGWSTWTWDGVDWTLRSPAHWPLTRYWHAMSYDRARNVVLLQGGNATGGPIGDFWQWNGSDWSPIAAVSGPGARSRHGMVYDESRQRTVVYGGQGPGTASAATWEWDGSSWSAIIAPTAVPNTCRMAFDHGVGQVALRTTPVSGPSVLFHWTGADWVLAGVASGNAQDPLISDPLRGLLTFPNVITPQARLYLFTSTPASCSGFGSGCSLGEAPGLGAIGSPQPGTAGFHLEVQTLGGAAPMVLLGGLQSHNMSLGNGCTLLVQPMALFAVASAQGWSSFPLPMPANRALLGLQLFTQAVVLDPAHSVWSGVTMSRGLQLTVGW